MKQNVYSSADFAGGRPLCTQILPAQGRPIKHSWHQKTRDTGLATLYRSAFLHFDTIPECDGQTDGYTALAKIALRRAVKTAVYINANADVQ